MPNQAVHGRVNWLPMQQEALPQDSFSCRTRALGDALTTLVTNRTHDLQARPRAFPCSLPFRASVEHWS